MVHRLEDLDGRVRPASGDERRSVQETLRARGYGEVGHIVEFFAVAPQTARTAAPSATAGMR